MEGRGGRLAVLVFGVTGLCGCSSDVGVGTCSERGGFGLLGAWRGRLCYALPLLAGDFFVLIGRSGVVVVVGVVICCSG